jgi:hypothetical protein
MIALAQTWNDSFPVALNDSTAVSLGTTHNVKESEENLDLEK